MTYQVLVSFVSTVNGTKYRYNQGQILETIPPGADWLQAGFVQPIAEAKAPAQRREKRERNL